jgi:hypothetical protein
MASADLIEDFRKLAATICDIISSRDRRTAVRNAERFLGRYIDKERRAYSSLLEALGRPVLTNRPAARHLSAAGRRDQSDGLDRSAHRPCCPRYPKVENIEMAGRRTGTPKNPAIARLCLPLRAPSPRRNRP